MEFPTDERPPAVVRRGSVFGGSPSALRDVDQWDCTRSTSGSP